MRELKIFVSPKGICRKDSAAIGAIVLMVIVLCLFLPRQTWVESATGKEQKPDQSDHKRLAGKWLRPDGGFIPELKDVKSDGRLKALYFNPKPINVIKAEWRRTDNCLQILIELRDVNYPGSTYNLVYSPEQDRLTAYYYQAALGQPFDVIFVRKKSIEWL